MSSAPLRRLWPFVLLLALLIAAPALIFFTAGARTAGAVEPGVGCSSYTGPDGQCVVEIGDIWFCDPSFEGLVCASAVVAGDTVRWSYPASGKLVHTTTFCGDACDDPTDTPLWDSGILNPGQSFELLFDTPGVYLYYCEVHPQQRGLIRVLNAGAEDVPGDANCNDDVDAVDAALMLQRNAGLVDILGCEENADVNGDGRVDSIDAALVLQFIAGLLEQLPS
jgi:hypothetical protein